MSDLSVRDVSIPVEGDDIDQVLVALKHLIDTTSSPIVRGCLEDAHEDILHLTGHDIIATEGENFPTAA
jgi:hypothetical protein